MQRAHVSGPPTPRRRPSAPLTALTKTFRCRPEMAWKSSGLSILSGRPRRLHRRVGDISASSTEARSRPRWERDGWPTFGIRIPRCSRCPRSARSSRKFANDGSERSSGCLPTPWRVSSAVHRVRFFADWQPPDIAHSRIKAGMSTRKGFAMRRVSASLRVGTRTPQSSKPLPCLDWGSRTSSGSTLTIRGESSPTKCPGSIEPRCSFCRPAMSIQAPSTLLKHSAAVPIP